MPSKQSYVVWNNKGGAGKTTLTFHLSTQYALENPDEDVVVVDMCPQANISTALLSNLDERGNGKQGDEIVRSLRDEKIKCRKAYGKYNEYDKTICGYLMAQIDKVEIIPKDFLVQPGEEDYNKHLPRNMYLLCGNNFLELVAKRLEEERRLTATTEDMWKSVTLFVKTFIDELNLHEKREYVCFIDTNPSFTIYTEMAVSAADRLIIPINSDDFSRTAVRAMLYLIYGIQMGEDIDEKYQKLRCYEYSFKAEEAGIVRPNIHAIVMNKITTYGTRAAKAFAIKGNEVSTVLKEAYKENEDLFEQPVENLEFELPDFHTMGIQCLHLGCPLLKLPTKFYMNETEQVKNQGKKNAEFYIEKLRQIVNHL